MPLFADEPVTAVENLNHHTSTECITIEMTPQHPKTTNKYQWIADHI
jgi:hypothetical protein